MSRRSEILAEMGLAPVWKLRAPAQPTAAADSGAAQGLEGSEAPAGRAGIAEGSHTDSSLART